MFHTHNTIDKRKSKHLTYIERQNIEYWIKEKRTKTEIAKLLGKSRKTIYLEIKRGSYTKYVDSLYREVTFYSANIAQKNYDYNKTAKGPKLILDYNYKLNYHIEKEIVQNKKSPEAIVAEFEKNGFNKNIVCAKTIRNAIKKGAFWEIDPQKIIYNKKHYKKTLVKKRSKKTPPHKSIEFRPDEANKRTSYGHWEGDLVIGNKKKGAALFVMTERMTREQIIRKIPNKKSRSIINVLNDIEYDYGDKFLKKFKSITFDNGSEFNNYNAIETSCRSKGKRTNVYYAHPYCSSERGSNENANKFIRRFIPKGKSIDNISIEFIEKIENWINNYPRKIFNYLTTVEYQKLLDI